MAEVANSPEDVAGNEPEYRKPVWAECVFIFDAYARAQGAGSWFSNAQEHQDEPYRAIVMRWADHGPDSETLDQPVREKAERQPERFAFKWFDSEISAASLVDATFHEDAEGTAIRLSLSPESDEPGEWDEALTLLRFRDAH